jgi:APA family basic amino acid/polyamine antiporter
MCGLPFDTWLRLGVWFAAGLGVYMLYGMRHSRVRIQRPAASLA